MECGNKHRNKSRDQRALGAEGKTVEPCTGRGTRLFDMFMAGKPAKSYADFHHEITKNVEEPVPEASVKQHHCETKSKSVKEEELVKYMSSVPSFLEKGTNIQDKALNVGVLDWGRLEKWQCSNRTMTQKNGGNSPASSSTSFFSTDRSSPHSSEAQSCSPASQRMHHRLTKCPQETSVRNTYTQDTRTCSDRRQFSSPSRPSPGHLPQPHQAKAEFNSQKGRDLARASQKFQDACTSTGSNGKAQQRPFGAKQVSGKIRLEKCEGRQHDSRFSSEVERPKTGIRLVEPALNVSTQVSAERPKTGIRLVEPVLNVSTQVSSERPKTVVLLLPRDKVDSCSDASRLLRFSKGDGWIPVESQKGISSNANYHESSLGSECFATSPACSMSFQDYVIELAERGRACYTDEQDVKGLSQPTQRMPDPVKKSYRTPVIQTSEEKLPIPALDSRSEVMHSVGLDVRIASESLKKSRTPSPIHKFGHGMTRIIKSASSRDSSPQRRSTSRDISSKSWAERAAAAVSSDNSCVDKSRGNNRARSSPLRRLLDPLLKAKGSPCIHPTEQLKYDDSVVTAGPLKPLSDQVRLHDLGSMKDSSGLKSSIGSNGSDRNSKYGSSSLQAILRVAVKNGLPLWTFAVDKSGDILAATLEKSGAPGEDHSSWVYTFFTICEIKRKTGIWPYQGSKKSDHGFVPNIVAHMKASDQHYLSSGQKRMGGDDLREFSLFALDVIQGDEPQTALPRAIELAAIVFRLPCIDSATRDGLLSNRRVDLSKTCYEECRKWSHPDTDGNSANEPSLTFGALSTTVILPGGVHSVPSNGTVSTLTQRWKSGGSCDCGGWDLGCQMRIYSPLFELKNNSNSCNASEEFKLFSEVRQENSNPVLTLILFRDCTYSVKFDPSISMLQAFAICVAVLECRRPCEFLEPSEIPAETASGLAMPEDMFYTKISEQTQSEAPPRYFAYPPHSPVGRV